jgi:hypothetical protein
LIAPCKLCNHSIFSCAVGVYTVSDSSGIVNCTAFYKTEFI